MLLSRRQWLPYSSPSLEDNVNPMLFGVYNYWIAIVLAMIGLYLVMVSENLIKKLVGLNIFQTAVFLIYITIAKVEGGTAPILDKEYTIYSNPLPHVLILTAIVVAVATTAVGLALIVRIREEYGSIEELEILAQDNE